MSFLLVKSCPKGSLRFCTSTGHPESACHIKSFVTCYVHFSHLIGTPLLDNQLKQIKALFEVMLGIFSTFTQRQGALSITESDSISLIILKKQSSKTHYPPSKKSELLLTCATISLLLLHKSF